MKRRTLLLISYVVIVVMSVALGVLETQRAVLERQLSGAVVAISGNLKGKLECQRFMESYTSPESWTAGYVDWNKDPNMAVLKWDQCEQLFKWMTSDKNNPTEKEIYAINVLTHETIHLSGNRNEASTECEAVKHDSAMAQLLGATPVQGDYLANFYFKNVWPYMGSLYQLKGCSI